jgi:hypothetical protein
VREVGDRPGEGYALHGIGIEYANAGEPDSALHCFRQALAIRRAVHDRNGEGATLSTLGGVFKVNGQPDSALVYLSQALAVLRELGDNEGAGETLISIGDVYFRFMPPERQDALRAARYFDSTAALWASIHSFAGGDANSISFAERFDFLYGEWALALLASGANKRGVVAALAATERGRAQALLTLMRKQQTPAPTSRMFESLTSAGGDLAAEGDVLLAPLRTQRTAVLSYLLTADSLLVWFLSPKGELRLAARHVLTGDSLTKLVAAVRAGLGADEARNGMARGADGVTKDQEAPRGVGVGGGDLSDAQVALRVLAALLIPPNVGRELNVGSEIVVIPHGVLGVIPFAALPVGRRERLGSRYALRFAPSLAAANVAETSRGFALGQNRLASLTGSLIVGNPAMPMVRGEGGEPARLRALPGAQTEGEWIAAKLNSSLETGAHATESAMRTRLPKAPLVHLATHGLAFGSPERARDSYVALAPDATHDGLLTMGELLDDPQISIVAELVVLSACQTGLGDLKRAEGTVGLQRAFLAKGARSVLVSLWSVDDEATALLMRRFYAHWLDDGDRPGKAEALRRAQADVRRRQGYEHPRYWAAFQLVGAR